MRYAASQWRVSGQAWRVLIAALFLLSVAAPALGMEAARVRNPFTDRLAWLPMTGVTPQQMDDARAAGYDTLLLKAHPPLTNDGAIDFSVHETVIRDASERGFDLLIAILGWVGLGEGYHDVDEDGNTIPGRLDPFHPEAMQRLERYYASVMDHYASDPRVIGFAPTWGIYGEAGFSQPNAGRSPHALDRFNEWRAERRLPALDALPTRRSGPNSNYNHFIRFRYEYLQRQFDPMVTRLRPHAGGRPVGMWQELYSVIGYLWTMVKVPSADFALYESAFPFQTTHDPARTLGETMGFRYQCASAEEYADYYRPLLARKRGEGQLFMGCQLSNTYAANYGWTEEKAEAMAFDQWEDRFAPTLRALRDAPVEPPVRDVLLVFPTYAAAALSDSVAHAVDALLIDVLLRMYGCQMERCGSPALDAMTIEEMDRFRLIVIPCACFVLSETLARLEQSTATLLFTGCYGQALDGDLAAPGAPRSVRDAVCEYRPRAAGEVAISDDHPIVRDLAALLPVHLPDDESFQFIPSASGPSAQILLAVESEPLLSIRAGGRRIYVHGHLFAGVCHDPDRKPPNLSGSEDVSANQHDLWGPHRSDHPQNAFARQLMKNLLDNAGVQYRVPNPPPRRATRYLADHMEAGSVSANLAYNNTGEPLSLGVQLPWKPAGLDARLDGGLWRFTVTVPAWSYVVLEPETPQGSG